MVATPTKISQLPSATLALSGSEIMPLVQSGATVQTAISNIVAVPRPLVAGGTTASSTLTLESTSGAGTSDYVAIKTGSQVEAVRVDTSQNVNIGVQGATIADCFGVNPRFEVSGVTSASMAGMRWANDRFGPDLILHKSRGGTQGTYTAVQANDIIGAVEWAAADGSTWQFAAAIDVWADGSPSLGSVPMLFSFQTGTNNLNIVERMRLDSVGAFNIGNQGGTFPDTFGSKPIFQICATDSTLDPSIEIRRYSANKFGPSLQLTKSRNNTVGTETSVQSGDFLGIIYGIGCDANASPLLQTATEIDFIADGSPTAGSIPGRIVLSTARSGNQNASEAYRINSDQQSVWSPGSVTPATLSTNGQFTLTPTSNTNFRISYRGSDGTTRVGNITLA